MTEDLKKFEDDSIVGEDSRGYGLTHYVLSERLMQVEHSPIKEEMISGPSYNLSEYDGEDEVEEESEPFSEEEYGV